MTEQKLNDLFVQILFTIVVYFPFVIKHRLTRKSYQNAKQFSPRQTASSLSIFSLLEEI